MFIFKQYEGMHELGSIHFYVFFIGATSVCQTGKTAALRRKAIRETDVSWYLGGPIELPLKLFEPSLHYRIEGLRWALYWSLFMPGDASLLILGWSFFPPSLKCRTVDKTSKYVSNNIRGDKIKWMIKLPSNCVFLSV